MKTKLFLFIFFAGILIPNLLFGQFTQQGPKLHGAYTIYQGSSVAISADGNTAIVGSNTLGVGEVWIFIRSGSIWIQQGPKLVGTGAVGNVCQGITVSISGDGNTAVVGGPFDNNCAGAVWIFTRSAGVWTQMGQKLVGTGAVNGVDGARQGTSVAISADGKTIIEGGYYDNGLAGAVWVFARSGDVWIQQGQKLVGTGAAGNSDQGMSVALSSDGNTAFVGGYWDNIGVGAVWVFIRSGGVWTQQGQKLVGTGAIGKSVQGISVSASSDGNTIIVGGHGDNGSTGAVWVFTRSGGVWTQQGQKLVGTGAVGKGNQGCSVSVSSDGNTFIMGSWHDNNSLGASWIFTRSGGAWTQQGQKLVGTGAVGITYQGISVAISGDGNTAIEGGPGDNTITGAVWMFTGISGVWTQLGQKLIGSEFAQQGSSVAISSDGNTTIVGCNGDNSGVGAIWAFTRSAGVWTQQGTQQGLKLVGTGAVGNSGQGSSVAVSADGNTLVEGGPGDNNSVGAVWIFNRIGPNWWQLGSKLVGTGGVGATLQGSSVAISSDGNTIVVGGRGDNNSIGAIWIFTRSGNVWTQQGAKIVGAGYVGASLQGSSVAISADGNTVIGGGYQDNNGAGAVWIFIRSGGVWIQQGNKLVGAGAFGISYQGFSVALSSDGNTALEGGPLDNNFTGAAWGFIRSGGLWSHLGSKFAGTGAAGNAWQGFSVSISSDCNTAVVGGPMDNNSAGAIWTFSKGAGSWLQQGTKLTGTGSSGSPVYQGFSVAISSFGNTFISGGFGDNDNEGAAWVFYNQTAPLAPLCERFEQTTFPPMGWQIADLVSSLWYKTTYSGFGNGSGSAVFDCWNGASGLTTTLTTFPFQPTTAGNDSLSVDMAYCIYQTDYLDSLIISTSTDGGNSFSPLVRLGGFSLQTTTSGSHPFFPTANQWLTRKYQVPIGTNMVQFLGMSGFGDYIYIDNVCGANGSGLMKPKGNSIPNTYSLSQNYPNPFNPSTQISFGLPKSGLVKLVIYDILGREVKTLVNEFRTAGMYKIEFDASSYASGVYFYKLTSGDYINTKKMVLIK